MAENRRRPRNPDSVASLYELKGYYKLVIEDLDECHRQRRAIDSVAKDRRIQSDTQKKQISRQRREIQGLTRSKVAADQAKKGAVWSAGSATAISILYRIWQTVTGYPGGRSWEAVWEMPEVVAVMTGALGAILAWCYKAFHPESRD
jgi:hypothetical protein